MTWALGDRDAALASYRECVALARKSPVNDQISLAHLLTNLAGVLTERGELNEALAAAREGLPLLKEAGESWIGMDHLALRAGLAGKVPNAARMAGYADSIFATKEARRQPNEARARDLLQAVLSEKLAPDELARLLSEGTKMSEDEACRIALDE
jgi:tetratricopeptide (TPR) repeat protein